jgi:hypothetical protein
MTTIAMVGGMLPSALALDSGGEFRAPMAIAVIGGLISSTVLSLLFVPAVFALMDDIVRLIWRIFGRHVGEVDEPGSDAEERRGIPSAAFSAAQKHATMRGGPDAAANPRPMAAE